MILAPIPMMIKSRTICPVTTSRAASLLAVMSPNPTVANTVTVKYNASVCVSGWLKLPADSLAVTRWVLANSTRNSGRLVARASTAHRPGNGDVTTERT
jgi:hypothetical protein